MEKDEEERIKRNVLRWGILQQRVVIGSLKPRGRRELEEKARAKEKSVEEEVKMEAESGCFEVSRGKGRKQRATAID